MANGKFEMFQDKAGEYRFRLKASNGETIGASEGYKAKASATNGIISVKKNALDAGRFEIFVGEDDRHYFRLKATNGETILQSQGYSSNSGAKNGVESVMANAPDAEVSEG
jgi:uncharacterized protein YegP (UPF0339 family)